MFGKKHIAAFLRISIACLVVGPASAFLCRAKEDVLPERSIIGTVTQRRDAGAMSSESDGLVSVALIDADNQAVRKVMVSVRRAEERAQSGGRPDLLRNGGSLRLAPGAWLIEVVPTADYPYTGDVELDVDADKIVTLLLQLARVKTGTLRIRAVSENDEPMKQVYLSSVPVKYPTMVGRAGTDVRGDASLLVPLGTKTIIKATTSADLGYLPWEQEIVVEEDRSEPLNITLVRKKLIATCTGRFVEDKDVWDMVLTTNGRPCIRFFAEGDPLQEQKAYVSDGRFEFYDLKPGKYRIASLSYPQTILLGGVERRYYAPLRPAEQLTFVVETGAEVKDLGSLAFDKWPAEPGQLEGSVSGLGDGREGVEITLFQVSTKGRRMGHEYTKKTDARGRFSFSDLVSGLYDIKAAVGGKVVGQVAGVSALPVATPHVTVSCAPED